MAKNYDVIIVGGGPAGIFAALELSQVSGLHILLLEKGHGLERRACPILGKNRACPSCQPCGLVSGWGGAGAFSDGKLTFSPEVGGQLQDYLGAEGTAEALRYVDDIYLDFGAPPERYGDGAEIASLQQRAAKAGLRLVPMMVRHLGTERCRSILGAMRDHLSSCLELRLKSSAGHILAEGGRVTGVEVEDGERLECRYLIVAPGREGADWLVREAQRLRLTVGINPIDIGVRVELPSQVLETITGLLYEGKLEYFSRTFQDRVRTFCMCPHGEVIMESTGGAEPVVTVNGHSYANHKTENTNFALLVSTTFTEPFHDPIAYGRYLARLANILSGGVIIQRLGDLKKGRRSTPARIEAGQVCPTLKSAVPGDISFALPYRHLRDIMEMLEALDRLAPGVASSHTLLYGVEVKFYSSRLQLSPHLETEVGNLFAIGDGAGVSRGLVQASASGVVAAREIGRRIRI